ncbi:hypothetical protein [Phytohabitans rumicis]|uniref:Uncharacterized protein n=1 Tax=Phytohabitans rumicis TaxID=1076125 RepID=A0A6V8LJ48_9ACTN|nr:hypothetical protein [Phytohabitans rumicis]GFJ94196.1 hypothetical protein Prum_078380 [Phytohabitans rumicis]
MRPKTDNAANGRLLDDFDVTADLGFPQYQWTHVSTSATLGLITGILALVASLTGLLAPQGAALGVVSVVICLVGLRAVDKPYVTGHGLVVLGLLAAVAAIVIGLVAMTGEFTWPNSGTNEVDRVHDWLDEKWSWLARW